MAKNNRGKRTQKRDTHTNLSLKVGRTKFTEGENKPLTLGERHAQAWENESRFYLFSQWLGDRKKQGLAVNLTAQVNAEGEVIYNSLVEIAEFTKDLMTLAPKPRKGQKTTNATFRWSDQVLDSEEFTVHLVECTRKNPSPPFLEELVAVAHVADRDVARNLHITPNDQGGFLEAACGGALLNTNAVLLTRAGTGHVIATCAIRDILSPAKRERLSARWARKSPEEAAAEKAAAEKAAAEKAAAEKAAAQEALGGLMSYVQRRRAEEAQVAEARRAEELEVRWRSLQGGDRLEAAWAKVLSAAETAFNEWAQKIDLVGQVVRPGSPSEEAFEPLETLIGLQKLGRLCDWVLETHAKRTALPLGECLAMCRREFTELLPEWVEHGMPAVTSNSCTWVEVKEALSHPVYAAAREGLVSLVEATS